MREPLLDLRNVEVIEQCAVIEHVPPSAGRRLLPENFFSTACYWLAWYARLLVPHRWTVGTSDCKAVASRVNTNR